LDYFWCDALGFRGIWRGRADFMRFARLAMSGDSGGAETASPIIINSRDLMNVSDVMPLTKSPLAPARSAETNSAARWRSAKIAIRASA
jgi:hypothetical protein